MVTMIARVKWKMRMHREAVLLLLLLLLLSLVTYEVVQRERTQPYTLADRSKQRQNEIIDAYMQQLQKDRNADNKDKLDDEDALKLLLPEPIKDKFVIPTVTFPPELGLKVKEKFDNVDIKYPGRFSASNGDRIHGSQGSLTLNKGGLEGGPGHCRVYDHRKTINESFDCLALKIQPVISVCLYDNEEDVHLSRHIREEGIWEPHLVKLFQEKLLQDSELGFIDIGANIGQYSLIAARMGRSVLAVEPFLPNLKRLHRATWLNHVEDKITVVSNAVSYMRGTVELRTYEDNQGGVALTGEAADPWCEGARCPAHTNTVLMDDLLEVTNFDKAIIKIDIEGHEHKAFVKSSKLLAHVFVPYIFMEWIKLREYYGSEVDESPDKTLVTDFVAYLTENSYHAYSSVTGELLQPAYWYAWTDDIVWRHGEAASRLL